MQDTARVLLCPLLDACPAAGKCLAAGVGSDAKAETLYASVEDGSCARTR